MQFDHLNLDEGSRGLIETACTGAEVVYLSPLDKGLSGSSVWLARWRRKSGAESKFHVFKIGDRGKLQREMEAIRDIASVIEPGFPNVELVTDDLPEGKALLRQEFLGDSEGNVTSLRLYLQTCDSPRSAASIVRRLYEKRLVHWHPPGGSTAFLHSPSTFGEILQSWWRRAAVAEQARVVGAHAIRMSLRERFGSSMPDLEQGLNEIAGLAGDFAIGPVHGDLHSQNVLVEAGGGLQVIDYGWTGERWRAVDFLMMECSLKFLVAPPHAQLDDLLILEELLEPALCSRSADFSALEDCMLPSALQVVARAIQVVRACALETEAVPDGTAYRAGLALMTASHTSLPGLNQLYLLHSLAYHVAKF